MAISETVETETGPEPVGSVIWLHGLGDTGRGWSHLKHELRLPQAVRYAFPDAPDAPVTCNGGYVMTSWMDLETIPISNGLPDDAKGLADSTQIIHALIDAEVAKGTASEDIVLGGFSQGSMLSCDLTLHSARPLAALPSRISASTSLRPRRSRTRTRTAGTTTTKMMRTMKTPWRCSSRACRIPCKSVSLRSDPSTMRSASSRRSSARRCGRWNARCARRSHLRPPCVPF